MNINHREHFNEQAQRLNFIAQQHVDTSLLLSHQLILFDIEKVQSQIYHSYSSRQQQQEYVLNQGSNQLQFQQNIKELQTIQRSSEHQCVQDSNNKKQAFTFKETVQSFNQLDQGDLERYNYTIEIKKERGQFRIYQYITQIEQQGRVQFRGEDLSQKQIRQVDQDQDQSKFMQKLHIRQVESIDERVMQTEGKESQFLFAVPINQPLNSSSPPLQLEESQYRPLKFLTETVSLPLDASPRSTFTVPSFQGVPSCPEAIQILIIPNALSVHSPPPQPHNSLPNIIERPMEQHFQREMFYSNTPSRIINTQKFIITKTDQPDYNYLQAEASLKSVAFPEKSRYFESAKPRQKPKFHLNFQYQRYTVPFQEELKFNIEKDFPKAAEQQTSQIPQFQYRGDTSTSNQYNSFSFPESQYNLPSSTWLYKENLKETPRLNITYNPNTPKMTFQTPPYNANNQRVKQKALPSVGKSAKISLYSPKAPKMFPKEMKSKQLIIKLHSPQKEVIDRREKSFQQDRLRNNATNIRQSEQIYTQPSNLSPKKQKLRLVQKAKPPLISLTRNEPSPSEQPRPSKQAVRASELHRQKIKITLRNQAQLDTSQQSKILIEYEQHEIPISFKIN